MSVTFSFLLFSEKLSNNNNALSEKQKREGIFFIHIMLCIKKDISLTSIHNSHKTVRSSLKKKKKKKKENKQEKKNIYIFIKTITAAPVVPSKKEERREKKKNNYYVNLPIGIFPFFFFLFCRSLLVGEWKNVNFLCFFLSFFLSFFFFFFLFYCFFFLFSFFFFLLAWGAL